MEFGALVCLPRNPQCAGCVLSDQCNAYRRGVTDLFPVKQAKSRNRIRYFNYLFIQYKGLTYIKQRKGKDIWHSLFEFPLIETHSAVGFRKLITETSWNSLFGDIKMKPTGKAVTYKHLLTHQTLHCRFYLLKTNTEPLLTNTDFIAIGLKHIHEVAVPRAIERYLEYLRHIGEL